MPPLVAIVLTTYNRQTYLDIAIASVLAQTFQDFELIVWDDGSTDDSVALAQNYANRDRRVRVIAAPHQGRVQALQAAIAQTQSTYLAWIDSDDWLAPTALEKTVQILDANPATGMVYTDYLEVDERGKERGYGKRCGIPYSPERLLVDFMTFHFRLLRRSLYDQVGGMDDSLDFVEDYDLCLRLSEVTPIAHLAEPLYHYRIHSQSASQQFTIEQALRTHAIVNRALQRRGMADTHRLTIAMPSGRLTLRCLPKNHLPRWRAMPTLQRLTILASLPICAFLPIRGVDAQPVPANDGTGTIVTPNGNRFDITGGTVSGDRANLFHSFQEFGLSPGQIANFLANPQLQNILARVVGNNPSLINGLVQVSGGSPNLFLINPAGIIFGSSASLNVPASFTATTANGVWLGNQEWHLGSKAADYAALNGKPNAFTFASSQPGAIVNAGNLAVGEGQTLMLLGGTIVNTGSLSAPGGTVAIAAVPGSNLVRLSQPGRLLNLEFVPIAASPGTVVPPTLPQLLTGGNLSNATGLTVDANGTVTLTSSGTAIPATPGTAMISGQVSVVPSALTPLRPLSSALPQVTILGSQVGLVGAAIEASGETGGTIRIGGDYQGGATLPTARFVSVDPSTVLRADGLSVPSNAASPNSGGRVIVWADQATSFWGNISARGGNNGGDGGFVEVSGKANLQFRGTVDTAAPKGNPGQLLLDPADIIIQPGTGPGFSGTVLFGDAAPTEIFQTDLQNVAGNVLVQATNSITFNTSLTFVLGDPGDITFQAGGAIVGANITAPGRNVTVIGNTLSLGAIDTSPPFSGTNGGTITLRATGNISTGNLISDGVGGNGYGTDPAVKGGDITAFSDTGSIQVGQISAVGIPGFPFLGNGTSASGGNVSLTTASTGGNITFAAINTQAGSRVATIAPPPATGGAVTIATRGLVRGTETAQSVSSNPNALPVPAGSTILTQGAAGGSDGRVEITHDGGVTNQAFTVGNAAVNGTAGAINTGGETLAGQVFEFPSSPFTSGGGSVRITFLNDTPTIAPIPALPTTAPNPTAPNPTAPNQVIQITAAALGITTADLNGDNVVVRIAAIAPGATLRINGAIATPGAILPANATLEFTPPPRFIGTLATAFSVTVDDAISTSAPRAIALTIRPNRIEDPCAQTLCRSFNPPPQTISVPNVQLPLDTPESRFTQAYAAYLGIEEPKTQSIDEQQDIAQTIERETGAKPAFLYVSFVPASLKVGNYSNQVKEVADLSAREEDSDQLELLVVTARGAVVRKRISGATRDKVMAVAQAFRREVADPRRTRSTRYLESAQQLYTWMIAPVQATLQERQITNVVFLLDAGLRSLPMAALQDGKQFLVERYSVGTMPSLSLSDTRYQDIRDAQVLSLGISESTQGQDPLPSVPVEVATLVDRLWPGQAFLNSRATLNTLKSVRDNRPFGIIHLATHANFRMGDRSQSYIQLWDEKLSLDQVRELGWNNPQIGLLVLSACATALGDREAELGFGGLAVQAGVKTALASLWQVNDVSTTALMTRFYRDLKTAPIKAEALRFAQLAMIRGQVIVDNNQILGATPQPIVLPVDTPAIRDRELSHPYYWSAFTIVGNPW
jgi:filamentous hemagglutinin family protein